MNSDLEKAIALYFDGVRTAEQTMNAIVCLDEKGRIDLKKHVFAWIEKKITSEQAIAKIRQSYNL